MDTNTIRKAVLKRPFQPFILRMVDGRTFQVSHPEYLAVSRRVVLVIDPTTEAGLYLEPVLISSLEPIVSPPSPPMQRDGAGGVS
jgi:hypothetical protein